MGSPLIFPQKTVVHLNSLEEALVAFDITAKPVTIPNRRRIYAALLRASRASEVCFIVDNYQWDVLYIFNPCGKEM